MKVARTAVPYLIVGSLLVLSAVWLYTAPRFRALSHPRELRGPTILLRGEMGGHTYSLHQYDRGAYGDVFLFGYLSDSGIAQMFDVEENGIRVKPEGAAKTFTAIGWDDARFTIPIGLDRILAALGILLLGYPFLVRWHRARDTN